MGIAHGYYNHCFETRVIMHLYTLKTFSFFRTEIVDLISKIGEVNVRNSNGNGNIVIILLYHSQHHFKSFWTQPQSF